MELAEFQQLLPKIPPNPTFPLLSQEFKCCFSWELLELLGEGPEKAGKNLNILSVGHQLYPISVAISFNVSLGSITFAIFFILFKKSSKVSHLKVRTYVKTPQ